jgi:hypothetical protein
MNTTVKRTWIFLALVMFVAGFAANVYSYVHHGSPWSLVGCVSSLVPIAWLLYGLNRISNNKKSDQ